MSNLQSLISYDRIPFTFVIFYVVGLTLFFVPLTQGLFIAITPFTLMLVAGAVFYYHSKWDVKTIIVFISIFVLSVFVEIIGVATGKLFGVYSYDTGLGVKIFHVPVLIGLNWLMLVYGSNALFSKFTSNKYLTIVGASALMVLYDYLLEIAAPLMKMWEFEPITPPIQNYVMWFIMAMIFHTAIEVFQVDTNNKPGRALFIIQLFFFLFIIIGHSIL